MVSPRQRRLAWLAVVGFAVTILTLAMLARGDADREPGGEIGAASEASAPHLEAAPLRARAGAPASEGPSFEAPVVPRGMDATAAPPLQLVPLESASDDPALPADRWPLDVTVVDRTGRAVPRARIVAVWGEWRTGVAVADEGGHATLRVPPGTRALEIVGADADDDRRFLFVHYHSLAGRETTTRVVVRTGSSVEGRLVRADGTPIRGVTVRAVPQAYGFSPTQTDAEGRFRLDVLEGEPVEVRFDGNPATQPVVTSLVRFPAPGRFDAEPEPTTPDPALLLRASERGVPSGRTDVVLVAKPVRADADLEVVVHGIDGRPLAGAQVRAAPSGRPEGVLGRTGVDGHAVLRGLPRWPTRVFVDPGVDPGDPRLLLPATLDDAVPGGAPVEVALEETAKLRGRVLDVAGRPVAGAWCGASAGHEYTACFASDADGRFEQPSNAPRGTRLQVSARFPMDQPTSRGMAREIVVGGSDVTIVLEPIRRSGAREPAAADAGK